MYLNVFAPELVPIDLTGTDEFESLVQSARELGITAQLPMRYQSRNVVVNGLRFHLLEWGEPSNPPVLLLHGGNQTAHSWDLVALALASRYHLVAVDQRGHGDSEWPRDADASIESMASDARLILGHFGMSNPVVFGHSMGGEVTMQLLVEHPDFARQAVLVDVGPEVSREGRDIIRAFVRSAREFDSLGEYIDRVAAYDPFRSREHIKRTARYNLLQRADGKFISKHDPRRYTIADGQLQAGRGPTLQDVARITCPVLVVRGGRSNVLLPELAERFVNALPSGALATVPNCGHNVHSQNTRGFLDVVLPFLGDV